MRIRRVLILLMTIALILASEMAGADVLYSLAPGTILQEGCVGPCMCPVRLPEAVTGTFLLVPTGSDPLFTHYNLEEISWTVFNSNGGIAHKITGQGTYKFGGEVALTQQLILDLNIDGGSSEAFRQWCDRRRF